MVDMLLCKCNRKLLFSCVCCILLHYFEGSILDMLLCKTNLELLFSLLSVSVHIKMVTVCRFYFLK